MKKSFLIPASTGLAAFAVLAGFAQASLPISVGNLVVLRTGDGSAALTNASTAVFIEEYTTAGGAAVNTIPLPIAAAGPNQPCTQSGSAASEGFLTVQGSGTATNVVFVGYGAAPGVNSVATSASTLATRVVGKVDLNGNIDTTTSLTDAYSGGNIRSACSDNGTQFWTSGSNGGVRYVASLGASTTIQANMTVTNVRVTDIAGGNLYCTSASGTSFGVSQVGTGLPTTIGNPTLLLNGFPNATGPSSYDFWFADAATIYVADDRTTVGGIQKWTDVGGTWTLQYTLVPTVGAGCRSVTGTNVGGTITLYATTSQASVNTLVSCVDTGMASTFTTLATAGTNMKFQGVRIIPGNGSTPSTSFCSGDAVGTTCTGCGNNGGVGRGCANSVFAQGSLLTNSGVASTSADTLVLTCSDMPGPGLFFQANALAGSPLTFGDGMLCAAVGIIRMGVVFPTAGAGSYPGGLTPNPIHIAGAPVNPGDIKHYQCWYRDIPAFCTTATFNTSNGVTLTWQ